MEKLMKSLPLFKERNCSVSIVLDSRTRRKNACEFPLSLRFTIDRKFFYYNMGIGKSRGTSPINSMTCWRRLKSTSKLRLKNQKWINFSRDKRGKRNADKVQ